MQTKQDLTLKAPHSDTDWIDEFLFNNRHNIHIGGGHLTIDTLRFLNRQAFTRPKDVKADDLRVYDALPYHIHFKVTEFINQNILTTQGLQIT